MRRLIVFFVFKVFLTTIRIVYQGDRVMSIFGYIVVGIILAIIWAVQDVHIWLSVMSIQVKVVVRVIIRIIRFRIIRIIGRIIRAGILN